MSALEQKTIATLYEAALGIQPWSNALDEACSFLHSDKGALFAENAVGESGGLWESVAIDGSRIDQYQKYYASIEPLAPAAHKTGRNRGQILTIDRLLEKRRFRQTEFFNDFWRPQGIDEFIGFIDAGPNSDEPQYIHLTFFRSARRPAFSVGEERRVVSMRYHLRQALQLQTQLIDRRSNEGALASWLVETTSRPAFVVDKRLRVISWNHAAEILSAKATFLRCEGRRLVMTDAWGPAFSQLRRLFESAIEAEVKTVTLVDSYTGCFAAADLHPAPELRPNGAAAMVFVVLRPVDWLTERPDIATLSACFGFTKREAEICILLARGGSAANICEHLHIGRETLKTHLKRIFGKANVHSQLSLVATIVRLLTR